MNMKYICHSFLCLLLAAGLGSCTSPLWEDHYSSHVDEILDITLMEAIKANPDLSTFASLLESAGLDERLSATQSYTVWAPDNDALSGYQPEDQEDLLVFLKNHISRFPYPTSGLEGSSEVIHMLDNKRISFSRSGNDFYFGSQRLVSCNTTVNNGILHVLDGYESYVPNIWEFMKNTPGFDSIYNYVASKEVYTFMESASTPLGVENGQTVYDSVFRYYNPLMYQIGRIKEEDSTYTIILPTNEAWTEMYDSISSYFVYNPIQTDRTRPANYPDSMQDNTVKSYMLLNMSFSGDYSKELISSLAYMTPVEATNYYSYADAKVQDPIRLFENCTDTVVSNGRVYMADHLVKTPDSWCPALQIEGEAYYQLYPDSVEASTRQIIQRETNTSWCDSAVSEHGYLEVKPYSSREPYVTYMIDDVCSTGYLIYCVFLPPNVTATTYDRALKKMADTTVSVPAQLQFELSYVREGDTEMSSTTYETNAHRTYQTDPYHVDTMLVTRNAQTGEPQPVYFPYTNRGEYGEPTVTLKIKNVSQEGNNRDTYIDCIIFEPVRN